MSHSDHWQSLVRRRPVRLALASILILAAVWTFVPYLAYRVAPSAFVNAELVRVAAPIAGRLTLGSSQQGRPY